MKKPKKKLTPEQRRRRRETRIIFINGKQKRVPREPAVDAMPVGEFIRHNSDPIWLLQNEMYEELYELETSTRPCRIPPPQSDPPPASAAAATDNKNDPVFTEGISDEFPF